MQTAARKLVAKRSEKQFFRLRFAFGGMFGRVPSAKPINKPQRATYNRMSWILRPHLHLSNEGQAHA
jgi:hypothetical protein